MAATEPSLKDVLASFSKEKATYLYVPLKRSKISSYMVVDHLVKKGEQKRYPSLLFHPLHHALHLTAARDILESFQRRNPSITIGSTKLGVFWSQRPKVERPPPPPKQFKIKIRGIETIAEQTKLAEAFKAPVVPETHNGITMGTHIVCLPSLSSEVAESLKHNTSRVSLHPINFCHKCHQLYTSRPSLHQCPPAKKEMEASSAPNPEQSQDDGGATNSPCGGETGDSPLTGSSTTPNGDEPAKLSRSNQNTTPNLSQNVSQSASEDNTLATRTHRRSKSLRSVSSPTETPALIPFVKAATIASFHLE